MGLLLDRVAEVSGYSPEQGLYDVAYSTGFLNFDHMMIVVNQSRRNYMEF